ncbi:MAG: ATP-binding cassette domain-containing protein [Clostridia bacterium]|nr:ATP-binding cassette domain-containing protein [Clostridia bacterium]
MKQQNDVLLKVDHLCQYFRLGRKDLKAVDDVSFEIRKGEAFGLVGESGCGKTTTGRSIIKLYNITSGNVYFKGERVGAGTRAYKDAIKAARADAAARIKLLKQEAHSEQEKAEECKAKIDEINLQLKETVQKNRQLIREAKVNGKEVDRRYAASVIKNLEAGYASNCKEAANDPQKLKELKKEFRIRRRAAKKSKMITQIQMIFQDPIASLDPRMTVREIIAEGLIIQGITNKEYINEKVYEILEMVGLVREHADRYPHEFSGGQRQRIGIARAIIMQPEMLIADEPISALDVSIQAQVINLLNDLRDRLGLTILFIAHDLSVVKYFSDRIGVMYFGKMVELADSDELFRHPIHPYTRSLLSAIPLPDPVYEKQRIRETYNPLQAHDYSVEQPTFREIAPGHMVLCNTEEFERYRAEYKEEK